VSECCVIARKDSAGLEKPLAVIVLRDNFVPSQALEVELVDFVKQRLARYKAPHWIAFSETTLPRNDRDKIDRKSLRARHA